MINKLQSGSRPSLSMLAAQAAVVSGKSKKPGKPKPHGQNLYLYGAVVVFVAGIAFTMYEWIGSNQKSAEAAAVPAVNAQNTPAVQSVSGASNSAGGQIASTAAPYAGDLRPKDFIKTLSMGGWTPKFVPVASLKFTGKPQTVYCLLYARLDKITEATWQRKGMLKQESLVNPFLRTVVLESSDSLNFLFDWHVESVTKEIKPPIIAPQYASK